MLDLHNIQINGAITGVASKDQSELTGSNVKIVNVTYGIMVFQKKAEYGAASIDFTETEIDNAVTILLIDKGSVSNLNGEKTVGELKIDVDQLYSAFEK